MRQFDLQAVIDEARFGRFHAVVLCWCILIMILDGYDLAIVGISLPLIMKAMQISPVMAGVIASSSLFGMMVGSILLGSIADRIGRRPAIVLCVLLFSVFSAAAGAVSSAVAFCALRFLAGLGLGGIAPTCAAQMTEYSPRRMRSMLVSLMFAGYSGGGVLAALLGKTLMENYGWRSIYYAAAVPIVLVPVIWRTLPESLSFLVLKGREADVRRIAQRLMPGQVLQPGDRFAMPKAAAGPTRLLGAIFSEGRAFSTLMFWVTCITNLFMVYGLSSWLTKLMASAGYSLGSALTFVMAMNLGAVVGAIGGGWLADRFNIQRVLIGMYLVAAVSIALLGYNAPTALLYAVVTVAGACTIGTQIVVYAYAGQFYPTNVRSTGVGWAAGIGRLGAMFGPILIGVIVGLALPLRFNFYAMAIPAVIGALAVALVNDRLSDRVMSRAAQDHAGELGAVGEGSA
ncbi:MFS transporter [Burkholderia lata]|uniref:MFS transporter n=1 Tax=Burkholderia lata (strain ATCC 17760 / DSM 23089 / LMG 22485 / NCIMB 9086 / R18194 / 383) TaxID=482957 RepID=UPI001452D8C2|nr:MFS transporter [Burkholderia lata]VWL88532.1 MFS transporter [Burkholderia lata]